MAAPPLPRIKRLLFSLVPVVLLFGSLELGLRLAGMGGRLEDPYVGFSARRPLFVQTGLEGVAEGEGASGAGGEPRRRWTTAPYKRTHFNAQDFVAPKQPGTLRIFCLGGSTTYGRPYDDATSFCGWLRVHLSLAEPARRVEVINAGGISYASYRVALVMEELVGHEPDAFVIYSGHNEFLERRTYRKVIAIPEALRGFAALLSSTRVYALARQLVERVHEPGRTRATGDLLPAEVRPLLDSSVGPAAYTRDDALAARVLEHYRFNLARMIDMARAADARPILVTPGSNLRDFSPFKSEPSLVEPAERERVEALRMEALRERGAGRLERALRALDAALALDERRADLYYERARVLLALERPDEAMADFERARDEDVCPLRATSSIGRALRETARQREVPLVDFEAWLRAEAPDGIPGSGLFLDHVHPSPEANRALALAIADVLARQGLTIPRERWAPDLAARARARVEAGLDPAAHGAALRNLSKVLAWAGKFEEADTIALEAVSLAPGDAGAHFQAGNAHHRAGRLERARLHYARAVELRPEHALSRLALGRVLIGQRRFEAAEAQLRAAVRLRPDSAPAHNALGMLLASRRRPGPALAHFERALQLEPGIEPARSMVARLRAAPTPGRPGDAGR